MNAKTARGRLRTLGFVLGGLLLSALLVAALFDPVAAISETAERVRLRWQLPSARLRWATASPTAYRIHVKGAIPLNCIVDAELTVWDGRLSEVMARKNPLVHESPFVQVPPDSWDLPGCSFENLTVAAMFLRLEADIEKGGAFGAPLEAQFDEQRGFVTEYRYGRPSRGGLLGYSISECCTWFEFANFTDLSP